MGGLPTLDSLKYLTKLSDFPYFNIMWLKNSPKIACTLATSHLLRPPYPSSTPLRSLILFMITPLLISLHQLRIHPQHSGQTDVFRGSKSDLGI